MTALVAPFPLFFSTAGVPLSGGTVRLGVANQNPDTSPVTVYWDAALTQPAAQPLQTSGGYVVRAGTPAMVYTSGDFSISVRDKNGALILYAPTSADYAAGARLREDLASSATGKGSKIVAFIQRMTGAVMRWVEDRLAETVSVKDFGALGDGITDDTTAIQKAIDALTSDGGKVRFPRGRYLFSATINANKPVTFVGDGSSYINNGSGASILLKAASLNGPGLSISADNVKLRDFTLQGIAGNGGDGIVVGASRAVIDDVGVYAMGRDGVRIGKDAGPSNCNVWSISNLKSKNNGRHGMNIDDKVRPTLPDGNGGTLTRPDLQHNGECGLYLGNNALNTFIGIVAQANGTYGVHSTSSSKINTFVGGDYEVNGRPAGVPATSYYDFFIESGSTGNTVLGGSYYNFPQSFRCDEDENLILHAGDGIYAGDGQYAGLQLPNINSDKQTVLDWYKKKVTFAPTVIGGTSAGAAASYTKQIGRATRVGDRYDFSIILEWTGHTGTGDMYVTGLPFLVNVDAGFIPVKLQAFGITKPADSYLSAMAVGNTFGIAIYSTSSSSTTASAVALAMDAAGALYISGTIEV